ncbi:phosphoribosyltransferase family protein [Parabacteroides sp. PF5-6]|uniref:ComF family protein n=1 Tax=Parabacteroides sp. PF5-6 TaxID=1742403 RepID=UPI00240755B0|nr:phosphoribosyltransferase family protein [Parabacteroides sp. PF5-6]MDF9829350.1 ComF family protein [Parabacteroides sp. PF5-6]
MMKRQIVKIWTDVLNLFYPNLCLLCETALVEGEQQVCARCLCGLSYTGFSDLSDNPVAHLLIDKERLVLATGYLRFEQGGGVRRLIHALKYYGNKKLGYVLGRYAARELLHTDPSFGEADVLLPVPLHPRKYRKRGYNQSEWIARGMASVLQIPVCTTAVRRDIMTESQTGKIGYSRWENVAAVFSVSDPDRLKGKYVLLVDDVITTGATAGACIDALSSVEGIKISFFTLAVALQ